MVAIVYITTEDAGEAKGIARRLLEERLVACANIVEKISSLFWWEGEIEEDSEALLLVKSSKSRVQEVTARVKELHSYDVPDITVIPVEGGLEEYLNWVKEETSG